MIAYQKFVSYFSTKTYLVGTQKNRLNEMVLFEHPKHTLKLMGKKIITLLRSKNTFKYTIRVPNSSDPDQAWHSVGPDLGTNCLRRLSTDDKSRC